MEFDIRRDTTVRTVSVEVTDGVELDVTRSWHRSRRAIKVDHVQVQIGNGDLDRVTVRGGLIRKDGTPSESVRDDQSWYGPEIGRAPEWVQSAAQKVLDGYRKWITDVPSDS